MFKAGIDNLPINLWGHPVWSNRIRHSCRCLPFSPQFFGSFDMKKIELTQKQFALVDDADFEWLNQWKWFTHNKEYSDYAARSCRSSGDKRQTVMMHRVILELTDSLVYGDHKNGDGLDNQRHNLRSCTPYYNQGNRRKFTIGTSRFKGVCWNSKRKKWQADIGHMRTTINLGFFNSENDAAIAYNKRAKDLFGQFAKLNIIPNVLTLNGGVVVDIRTGVAIPGVSRASEYVDTAERMNVGDHVQFKKKTEALSMQRALKKIGAVGKVRPLGAEYGCWATAVPKDPADGIAAPADAPKA